MRSVLRVHACGGMQAHGIRVQQHTADMVYNTVSIVFHGIESSLKNLQTRQS